MLVLLPPSEGKTAPGSGDAVDLSTLNHAGLTEHRSTVLRGLVELSAHPDAHRVLRTGRTLTAEVERNARLLTEPTAPASAVYSGVLYAAASLDALPDRRARARAAGCVRIVSALWGLVSPDDRVPAYRLSMAVDLPGVGPLARSWRPLLTAELDPCVGDRLVVDCRSAAYAAAWRPPAGSSWVTVRVLRDVGGRRSVVSHDAKRTRGLLTRHLLVRGPEPRTPEDLLDAAAELVGGPLVDAELSRSGHPRVLTLTVA